MSDTIDITGLDKVELLRRLHENQIVAGFFTMMGRPAPPFDEKEAVKFIENGYIDYFCGRAIKTDLSADFISPRMYDRDAGTGTFARIVADMRN